MRHRWPKKTGSTWSLVKGTAMPGYSEDQYQYADVPMGALDGIVYDLLQIVTSPIDRAINAGNVVTSLLALRVNVSALGYVMCSLTPCTQGDALYDQYSTPTRDARIQQWAELFRERAAAAPSGDVESYLANWRRPVVSGLVTTFVDYLQNDNGATDKLASDPTLSFAARWGETPASTDAAFSLSVVAWREAWRERVSQVAQAQALCFPNGANTASCSHTAAATRALSTDRLDSGLRMLASSVRAAAPQVSQTAYHAAIDPLAWYIVPFVICSWKTGDESCKDSDWLIGDGTHDLLGAMTSAPWDSANVRFGVPQ
jgi:hypothetical protein